jgi:hypothetical protein
VKRLIWLPIAGFLLIAGATMAAAAPAVIDSVKGNVVAADPSSSPGTTTTGTDLHHPGQDLLTQVLSDLVSQNVITQAQSDAITQALQDKVTQQQADMEARRQLIAGFIADGVITQDEINQLPADDPMRVAFDSIANNGQITLDQLRGLGPGGFGFGHDGPMMHGRGPGGMWFVDPDGNNNPSASPSPSASSTSNS